VNAPHQNLLRINVGFLLNQPVGTTRDIHFETQNLSFSNDLTLVDFSGILRLGRTPQGLLAQGEFGAFLMMECVRCLSKYHQSLHINFSELYAFRNKPISDSGLTIPGDWKIDFSPLVREYMLLEVPIKPLCHPNCKGLCIECGANLNEILCEHALAKPD